MDRIDQTPEWKALEQHAAATRDAHLRDLFAADPGRGERLTAEAAGLFLDYSKNRITDETLAAPGRPGGARRPPRPHRRRCSAASRSTSTEDRAVLHVALRAPEGDVIEVDGVERRARASTRSSTRWPTSATASAVRRVDRPHGQAHPQRRQHRHRRLRPRAGDGRTTRCAGYSDRGMTLPVRVATSTAPTSVEATHDLDPAETLFIVCGKTFTTLETLTNARIGTRRGCSPASAATRRRSRRHFVAVSTNADEGRRVRDRHRQHVRVLGLGRRPLLVRLGDRAVADGRDRARAVPRDARRLPRDGRALPHRAVRAEPAGAARPHRHLVRRLLRRRDAGDPAVQPVPRPVPARTSSSSTWRATASRSTSRATRSPSRPDRSCGARRAPTASTPTTSSSTRARSSSRPTSSGSSTRPTRSVARPAATRTC